MVEYTRFQGALGVLREFVDNGEKGQFLLREICAIDIVSGVYDQRAIHRDLYVIH